MGLFVDGVQVLTPRIIKSPYSTEGIEDWDNPIVTPLPCRCTVQPETSTEIQDGGDRVTVRRGWRLITEPPAVIDVPGNARFRVPGVQQVLSLVGLPEHWTQVRPHTELNLEVFNG